MKKINLTLGLLLGTFSFVSAQVGINTPSPVSTLDITAKNATGKTTNVDGLLIPRVDRERAQNMAGVQTSTIIYVNNPASGTQAGTAANIDAAGYYYFNGTVWTKLNSNNSSSVNIYNSDGTLTGNRIVTQADKTLAFTGTANNAFSVDSKTFSVDAANHRVGIGTTTPENTFHVVNTTPLLNRFSLMDAPANNSQYPILALRNISPLAVGNYSLLGFTNSGTPSGGANWGIGSIVTATANHEDFFLGNSQGSNYIERFRVTYDGNIGIGTSTPTNLLDVAGTARIRTLTPAAGSTVVTPVYSDANGVLVKASPSMTYGGVTSSKINNVASGATATLYNGLVEGYYKAVVLTSTGCGDVSTAEFIIHNFSLNSYYSLGGQGGFRTVTFSAPVFTQTVRNTVNVTWGTSPTTCNDGSDGTSMNYTVSIPTTGTINITNNGNISKNYQITLTRLD